MVLSDFILANVPLPTLPSYLTRWEPGRTPLSTEKEVVTALAVYLATIFGIQAYMKDKQPIKANGPFQVHNTFLYVGSGILLALILDEIVPIGMRSWWFDTICSSRSWTSKIEFYYMINYYFKYVELIDTVFLAIKKKPLAFLHVFHHSATALLCYTQLNGKTSISWVPITLNLAVHVVMYYYYFATARGQKIWWKKYLTTMQITQFVIDIVAVYYGTYSYFAAKPSWKPYNLPTKGSCAGTEGAALLGCALLTSYLFLFINFYIQTYKKPVSKPAVNGHAKANGIANGNGVANGVKAQ